jgi:hypothetical protein
MTDDLNGHYYGESGTYYAEGNDYYAEDDISAADFIESDFIESDFIESDFAENVSYFDESLDPAYAEYLAAESPYFEDAYAAHVDPATNGVHFHEETHGDGAGGRVDYAAGTFASFEPTSTSEDYEAAEAVQSAMSEEFVDYPEAAEVALAELLATMSPAESIDLGRALRQISRAGQQVLKNPVAAQVAGTVLPVAGAAVGTVVGGPIGTALGGTLGKTAAGAFTGGARPTSPAARPAAPPPMPKPIIATSPRPAPAPPTRPASPAGAPAAARLLNLTQNPNLLMGLLALALGPRGRTTVPVGPQGSPVPATDLVQVLASLAGQAVREAGTPPAQAPVPIPAEQMLPEGETAFSEEYADSLYEALIASSDENAW